MTTPDGQPCRTCLHHAYGPNGEDEGHCTCKPTSDWHDAQVIEADTPVGGRHVMRNEGVDSWRGMGRLKVAWYPDELSDVRVRSWTVTARWCRRRSPTKSQGLSTGTCRTTCTTTPSVTLTPEWLCNAGCRTQALKIGIERALTAALEGDQP